MDIPTFIKLFTSLNRAPGATWCRNRERQRPTPTVFLPQIKAEKAD
jgi:hypothetical protein